MGKAGFFYTLRDDFTAAYIHFVTGGIFLIGEMISHGQTPLTPRYISTRRQRLCTAAVF